MAVTERIRLLILRWRNGKLTPEERKELDSWYDRNLPENLLIDENTTEDSYRQALLTKIHAQIGERNISSKSYSKIWLRAAAILLLAASAVLIIFRYSGVTNHSMPLLTVNGNTTLVKRLVLPDSSIIWLKGNSTISFPQKFDRRNRLVTLHGEALFEVSHHSNWPFKIRSGNFTTTVLGTSFNIRTGENDDDYNIDVLTGRVQVVRSRQGKDDDIYYVKANEVFKAAEMKVETVPTEEKKIQRALLTAGTTYDMDFDKVPFEAIMHQFASKFDMEFEGYTGEYKACTITADLTGLPMEKALKILCLSINATYKITGNKIKLTGGGCF